MTIRDIRAVGVPSRVDTFQPDPRAAMDFYGPLFGWSFEDPAPMPAGLEGSYYVARLRGQRVAGIGQAPALSPAMWNTHVRVNDVGETLARAEQSGGTRLAGPFGTRPDGVLAVVADATGVPFCLWQAGEGDGDGLANEPNTWAMSSLHTPDLERAGAFYGAMFEGTRVGPERCLLTVAARRPGRGRGDGDGRRLGPAPLERQLRCPGRGLHSPARRRSGRQHPDGTGGHAGISQRGDWRPPGWLHRGQRSRRLIRQARRHSHPALEPGSRQRCRSML